MEPKIRLRILAEGNLTYGDGSFTVQKGSTTRIETQEDCKLYTIAKKEYEWLVMENGKVLLFNYLLQQEYFLNFEYRLELLRCNSVKIAI